MIALCPFLQEINVAKEKRAVQRVRTVAPQCVNPQLMTLQLDSYPVLTCHSKSYPGGKDRLAIKTIVPSQSILDGSIFRQVNIIAIVRACSTHGGTG
jgi:hypothetical protein